MKPEQILEIARRYTVPQEGNSLLVEFDEHDVPTPTGETMSMETWYFCEEELIAFAKAVIEMDRECSDEPVAWYDKHGMITHDPFEGVTPLYTRPAPARKPLSEDEIEEIRREFPSRIDLLVRAIEKAHGIGETE